VEESLHKSASISPHELPVTFTNQLMMPGSIAAQLAQDGCKVTIVFQTMETLVADKRPPPRRLRRSRCVLKPLPSDGSLTIVRIHTQPHRVNDALSHTPHALRVRPIRAMLALLLGLTHTLFHLKIDDSSKRPLSAPAPCMGSSLICRTAHTLSTPHPPLPHSGSTLPSSGASPMLIQGL